MARGERWPLVAAATTYFLLLCGYYILRSLREAMALEAGRENIPTLFTLSFVVMLAILPLYWWIVARVPKRRLLACVYLPIVALFAILATAANSGHVPPKLAAVYFISVVALNLFMISVFWSVMVDLWRPDSAQRVFGIVAGGGSVGALVGPAFNAFFVQRLGATSVIYVACILIASAVIVMTIAQRLRMSEVESTRATSVAVGGRALDDLRRLVRSPYLLGIAGLIVLGQLVGAVMYNEQAKYVESAYTSLTERAALFARVDLASNVLALGMQTLLVGWLTARGGVRATLTVMGALVTASFAILALFPGGALLLITQVIRRSADYGLFKPAREMLFTVLSPESKFKSKSLLDTVLQRGSDSMGNGIYVLVAGFGLASLSSLCAAACVLLTMGARWLGAAFADQESKASRSR